MTTEELQAALPAMAPGVAAGMGQFPAMGEDLSGVVGMMDEDVDIVQGMPVYLAHYDDLVARMDRNVDSFEEANVPMDLMPWMFVGPGALIAALAALQLAVAPPRPGAALTRPRPAVGHR